MSRPARADVRPSPELAGAGLLVPLLQAEPLPIQMVEPSPCSLACPAGINVKSYVSLIAEGRFEDALEVVRERCPLPGICGRICHHPCEAACKRADIDEPVAIRSLKRFVADLALDQRPPAPPEVSKSERVAVIGSGPAGLTAAYDLRRAGYPVVVFEAESEPGGMLRYGIADYRLPTNVLDAEIAYLESAGIEILTDCRVGGDRELEDLLGNGYSAALLAVGAQRGRRLRVEGEQDCPEVEDALAFLRRVNRGELAPVSGTVLVIGGGSTAVEAARTALRLGAERVEIVYRRHRGEMPADDEEVSLAAEEGIVLRLLTAPSRIVTDNGKLRGLECLQVALGDPDDSGRRRPVPISGSEFVIAADRILAAVGQEVELDFLPSAIAERMVVGGLLAADPETLMTSMHGVFAAGDVVSGPSTVIDAVATGHRAAAAIRRFLEQGDPSAEAEPLAHAAPEYEIPSPPPHRAVRLRPPHGTIEPGREFDEVERAFAPTDAVAEAGRCLRCGPCSECLACAPSCGRRHLALRQSGGEPGLSTLVLRAPARLAAGIEADFSPAWLIADPASYRDRAFDRAASRPFDLVPSRVTIEPDLCRGCARCIEVCSFGAISLVDAAANEKSARVEPALCRGCNLCSAVCPTTAVQTASFAPGWWGRGPEDLYPRLLAAPAAARPTVVLACQRRAEAVEESLASADGSPSPAELVPIRCAGQLDAGLLLELYRHGAERILVAGCLTGSCRYGFGPQLAAQQVMRATTVLAEIGADPGALTVDWAGQDARLEVGFRPLAASSTRSAASPASREL